MSEREKQNRFLKELMRSEDCEHLRRLHSLITKAERDEKCIASAFRLVALVAMLSAAGLGYSAVFEPEFFQNVTPTVVKFFTILGLASLICLAGFLGFWLWQRAICNRLYQDVRNFLISLHNSDPDPDPDPPTPFPSALVHKQGV